MKSLARWNSFQCCSSSEATLPLETASAARHEPGCLYSIVRACACVYCFLQREDQRLCARRRLLRAELAQLET